MPARPRPAPVITREQALAHRLAAHHLHERAPPDAWDAVAAVGVTDTPPGNALLGLHARMEGVTSGALDERLESGALVNTWSLRISPRLVPAGDLALFTTALIPRDDPDVKAVLGGHEKAIAEAGLSLLEALRHTTEAMEDALSNGPLGKGELSAEVTKRVPEGALIWCRGCGVHHVPESLFRLAARYGRVVLAPRAGKEAVLQLLPRAPKAAPAEAAADLARRYVHAYGPTTANDFAAWAGISRDQGAGFWERIAADLAEVQLEGARAWVLRADLPALEAAATPEGVRLLPPHDAYLEQRDRDLLLPDRERQKEVWKAIGNPGALLVRGEIAGTWRGTVKGKTLNVEVAPFGRLPAGAREAIRTEAEAIATLRGGLKPSVTFRS